MLSRFLEQVALVSDLERGNEGRESATLMTLHAAKGLEFPLVFMIGMEEKLFPHVRSLEDPEQMEEERRLCYVGMTRARERLFLTNARRRRIFGQDQYNQPSRFLADIPRAQLDQEGGSGVKVRGARSEERVLANRRRQLSATTWQRSLPPVKMPAPKWSWCPNTKSMAASSSA